VTNGFLDELPVSEIRAWEAGFLDYVNAQYPQVANAIRTEKAISKDTEANLKRAVEAFNASRNTGKAA
jgi:F-type H+-transporting ATPase subunit alpha